MGKDIAQKDGGQLSDTFGSIADTLKRRAAEDAATAAYRQETDTIIAKTKADIEETLALHERVEKETQQADVWQKCVLDAMDKDTSEEMKAARDACGPTPKF